MGRIYTEERREAPKPAYVIDLTAAARLWHPTGHALQLAQTTNARLKRTEQNVEIMQEGLCFSAIRPKP